jgi:hypothetical protein
MTIWRSPVDFELFEIEIKLLNKVFYKIKNQFNNFKLIPNFRKLLKLLHRIHQEAETSGIAQILRLIEYTAETFYQFLNMGLNVPVSMTCVAALGRMYELIRRIDIPVHVVVTDGQVNQNIPFFDDDEDLGEVVQR